MGFRVLGIGLMTSPAKVSMLFCENESAMGCRGGEGTAFWVETVRVRI